MTSANDTRRGEETSLSLIEWISRTGGIRLFYVTDFDEGLRLGEIKRDIYNGTAIPLSEMHASSLETALARAASRFVSFFSFYCLGALLRWYYLTYLSHCLNNAL